MARHQTNVVEHGACVEQLGVEFEPALAPSNRAEVINATRVIKEESVSVSRMNSVISHARPGVREFQHRRWAHRSKELELTTILFLLYVFQRG